jgi:phthalate 4,5-dioxygenase
MLRAAKALTDKGTIPPGVDPAHQRVRSVSIVLEPSQAFKEAAKDALLPAKLGLAHTTV